jgi:hypothetical protein
LLKQKKKRKGYRKVTKQTLKNVKFTIPDNRVQERSAEEDVDDGHDDGKCLRDSDIIECSKED